MDEKCFFGDSSHLVTCLPPFEHYRPVFGTWLAGLSAIGINQPLPLAVAGFALALFSSALAFLILKAWLPPGVALIAATLFAVHPARESNYFWISAQIDGLALVLSLGTIVLFMRFRIALSNLWLYRISIAGLTAAAVLTKESALALPIVLIFLPDSEQLRRRIQAAMASAIGALVACIIGFIVLHGSGRAGYLLTHIDIRRAITYPIHMIRPADTAGILMRSRLHDNYLEPFF